MTESPAGSAPASRYWSREMIRVPAAAAALSIALCGSAVANPSTQDPAEVPAGAYVLDKQHASLTVKILHMGFSHYTMRFNGLEGGFTYDPANWLSTQVTFSVDAKSIDTNNPAFNKQISSYFEADKYPSIRFASTVVQGAGGKGTLTGNLTLHGVTKPVTLDLAFAGAGHGITPLGTRLGFSASTRIKRSDFGVSNFILDQFTGDDVEVIFEGEFERK
jgi:polyisoprenoid-binding protein YceI